MTEHLPLGGVSPAEVGRTAETARLTITTNVPGWDMLTCLLVSNVVVFLTHDPKRLQCVALIEHEVAAVAVDICKPADEIYSRVDTRSGRLGRIASGRPPHNNKPKCL